MFSLSFSNSSGLPYHIFPHNVPEFMRLSTFLKLFEGCLLAFSNMFHLLFSHLRFPLWFVFFFNSDFFL